MNSYISIDLETTGLNPKLDKIIEIGAVKVVDGLQTQQFHAYVYPGRELNEHVAQLTGISREQLADAPKIEEVLPDLLTFLEDLPLLGHKILFDFSFLKKAAVDRKLTFDKEGADTLKLARRFLPELEHKNLGYLCEYYRIPIEAHRALEDAKATALLYEKMKEQFFRVEQELFLPKRLIYNVKRDTPATPGQKEQLYRLIAQHKLNIDFDVEALSRSEASRYADKIRSGAFQPAD